MQGTRDIAFSVSLFSRFYADPSLRHWRTLKHHMRYLKGTRNFGILYTKPKTADTQASLQYFSDADWTSDEEDRKSVTRWLISMTGGPIC